LKRIGLYFAIAWTVLLLTIIWYVDFDAQMQQVNQTSDYLMTFHTAGWVVQHGQLDKLYPPSAATGFARMPFDVIAHQLLNKMPVYSVAEFMYMPLAAALFVPFSFLPLNISLFSWQIVSLLSVFLSVQLVWLALKNREAKSVSPVNTTDLSTSCLRLLGSLFVIPVCLTIWIGQVGIVFGMVPLACGFYLLSRKKVFLAGLIWALAVLKPQFLVPVAVILFALLLQKKFSAAWGALLGVAAIAIINLVAFSPTLNLAWLNCLRISDIVYSDPRSGISTQIATSLPRSLILLLPVARHPELKMAVYGLAGAIFCSALATVWIAHRRSAHSILIKNEDVYPLACLIGILVTPLVMPHFFLYDYCLFALALPFAYASGFSTKLAVRCGQFILLATLLINTYATIVMAAHKFAFPLLFMFSLLAIYATFIYLALSDDSVRASR
jgi:hypothetical protein